MTLTLQEQVTILRTALLALAEAPSSPSEGHAKAIDQALRALEQTEVV